MVVIRSWRCLWSFFPCSLPRRPASASFCISVSSSARLVTSTGRRSAMVTVGWKWLEDSEQCSGISASVGEAEGCKVGLKFA